MGSEGTKLAVGVRTGCLVLVEKVRYYLNTPFKYPGRKCELILFRGRKPDSAPQILEPRALPAFVRTPHLVMASEATLKLSPHCVGHGEFHATWKHAARGSTSPSASPRARNATLPRAM